jgi:hypothetical protein
VRVDSLALQMRPRAAHEAADLGIRLCQTFASEVYRCYLLVAIPIALLSLALFEIRPWLPILTLWWLKPWLDRTVLYVLSRAAFGQRTTLSDLWHDKWQVWFGQLILTLTWRRLSPWRSFTQAVYQLEGHSFFRLRQRIVQIRRKYTGPAAIMTAAFHFSEEGLFLAFFSLAFWLAPGNDGFDFTAVLSDEGNVHLQLMSSIAYVLTVLFLEPFYVAAGFGMYLNRRAELEAWDIEQEFRRAFAS